jgi:hypothetical protein
MLIPFGILSAAGIGSDYELIETQILGSAAASITFTGLATYASVYKHLQIRALARTTRAAATDGGYIRLNGDTGSNYAHHTLYGDGTSVLSINSPSQAQMAILGVVGNTATANMFVPSVLDILDAYSSTKNKTLRSLNGITAIGLSSGLWMNTASLTSITLTTQIGPNWLAGSRFSLYGIKG